MSNGKKCDACGRPIGKEKTSFVLRIALLADPTPPEITKEDMEKDWRAEMEALIKAMEKLDPQEAQDEVYEQYTYCICGRCRKRLHIRLKFPFLSID